MHDEEDKKKIAKSDGGTMDDDAYDNERESIIAKSCNCGPLRCDACFKDLHCYFDQSTAKGCCCHRKLTSQGNGCMFYI